VARGPPGAGRRRRGRLRRHPVRPVPQPPADHSPDTAGRDRPRGVRPAAPVHRGRAAAGQDAPAARRAHRPRVVRRRPFIPSPVTHRRQ
jgi:hypothetical protein